MKEKLQKLRSNSLCALCWVIITCGFYILIFGRYFKEAYSIRERAVFVILSLILVLAGHELVHALFATFFAPGKVKITTGKDPLGLWSLRTVFPSSLNKCQRLITCLAPFAVLTITPTIALFLGANSIFLFFLAMLNCIGSYFDLIDTCAMIIE